ncbi:MAG: hypothetical protein AAGD07_04865 [Planctomycetota bacterium]
MKQISEELFGKDAWLEFNLSQFSQNDLIGALHQVRDKVLEVGIPVVSWDEFDSKNYHWLQYLLAPMQDGRFQEGQLSHRLGSCVFIFAGGTAPTYDLFGPQSNSEDWNDFKLSKGPDFTSRLDGYLNVLGPNTRLLPDGGDDPLDTSAPIRRALLLRQFLCGSSEDRLGIDYGLLRMLLTVPRLTNGARSLQKLAQSLKPALSALPISVPHHSSRCLLILPAQCLRQLARRRFTARSSQGVVARKIFGFPRPSTSQAGQHDPFGPEHRPMGSFNPILARQSSWKLM